MAGHGVKAVYQPFSLQERMAPLNMMKEEYDKINEGLAELGATASQAMQYIDPSSQAGQAVAAYNKSLEDAAATLSTEGLKGMSRTALYNLKRTYQSQIAPINEGAKRYAALQAQIKEMQWKDPTIMVSDMPTLDQYIANPNALPNVVSGAQLMQAGANAALTMPNVTYEQLSRYMNGDTSAIPDLDKAAQNIASTYGVSTEQALAYIQRGIQSGLGERTTKWDMARQEYDYKHALDMEKERYEQQQLNSRHYSSLAQSQQQFIAKMQQEGWGWDPKLNGGKGAFYQDDSTLERARKAALAGSGYDPNSVVTLTTGTGSGTRSSGTRTKSDVETTVKENFDDSTRGIDAKGRTIDVSSIPSGSQQVFVSHANLGLLSTDDKVAILKLAGIDASGAREAGTKKERYVDSAVDRLLSENASTIDRFDYFKDGNGWYRKYKNKSETIARPTLPSAPVQKDSVHSGNSSMDFGVTRRQ